jgi:hypothetical protein
MTDEDFERAVREHRNRVHRHAFWLLQNGENARDVTQEAMVRLWRDRAVVLFRELVFVSCDNEEVVIARLRGGLDRRREQVVRAADESGVRGAPPRRRSLTRRRST